MYYNNSIQSLYLYYAFLQYRCEVDVLNIMRVSFNNTYERIQRMDAFERLEIRRKTMYKDFYFNHNQLSDLNLFIHMIEKKVKFTPTQLEKINKGVNALMVNYRNSIIDSILI